MRARLDRNSGSAAVEFSLIAPLLIVLAVGAVQAGLLLWKWNVMQSAAETTARCLAIGSSACANISSGCTSSDAGICFALDQANKSGISELTAANVTIQRSVSIDGAVFTQITITLGASILAIPITLVGTASFPNN